LVSSSSTAGTGSLPMRSYSLKNSVSDAPVTSLRTSAAPLT